MFSNSNLLRKKHNREEMENQITNTINSEETGIENQIENAINNAMSNINSDGKIIIIQNLQIVLNNAHGGGATISMR